jgi:predicted DNA-binding transcriptional regulator AlpA
MFDKETRLIDLTVADLLGILKATLPVAEPERSAPADEDEIGGYEVAEKVTGYARQTIYQLKSKGQIPYMSMPTGGVRFSKKAILEWLMSRKKMTEEEVVEKAADFTFKRKARRKYAGRGY